MSYTQGQWEIEPWVDGLIAIVAQDDDANGAHVVASLGGPDAVPNARLFLHSRELLAFLRELDASYQSISERSNLPADSSALQVWTRVRDLIAKATGATP